MSQMDNAQAAPMPSGTGVTAIRSESRIKTWFLQNRMTLILFFLVLVGAGLILYPTFSDWWNSFHQSRAVASYMDSVTNLDPKKYDDIIKSAEAYNERLSEVGPLWTMDEAQNEAYMSELDLNESGIMGYITIDKIHVMLPIYHGTDEAILQTAIGHIEGSSLPVGGIGTHCVISGHRGLPSAKLFTDLDQLQEGDIVQITVLDEVLTYEIDQIRIVMPNELEELAIDPRKDYLTLVTCTPYGINSHRMLVRGHRIDNPDAGEIRVTSDASQIEPLHVLPVVIGIIAAIMLIVMLVTSHRSNQNIKAYRNLTIERHEKEKAFSMEYYYTRHPDRRPKEETRQKQSSASKEAKNRKKSDRGRKKKHS